MKKVDSVYELLQYTKHLEEPIILEHHNVQEDLQVLSKSHMTVDLSRLCNSDIQSPPAQCFPYT